MAKNLNKNIKNTSKKEVSYGSVMAKSDDGSIQITYRIPFEIIKNNREKAAKHIGEHIEIKGFRKGNAPLTKLLSEIPQNDLLQETLSDILPQLLTDVINKHKINPATYPKFELLKAEEGSDWEVRIITCEIPEIDLTGYKKTLTDHAKTSSIWTPSSAKAAEGKPENEVTREEKEQEVIKLLLDNIKVDIPKYLVNEEVNQKLSQLLERLEKLGVDLESYLKSIGKTAENLREDYSKQASDTLMLDIILTRIADLEGLRATDEEVQAAIAATSDPNLAKKLDTPEQKSYIRAILTKRKALDSLISLM